MNHHERIPIQEDFWSHPKAQGPTIPGAGDLPHGACCGLNVYIPPSSCVENLLTNVVILVGGVFGTP